MAHVLEQLAPDNAEHKNAEEHAHELDVQPHVAIEHMTELMGNHALQFVTSEFFHRAPGHRHCCIGGRKTGGESVDAGLLFEHVDFRYRHPGGDGDFLDHIAQASVVRVARVGRHQSAAERLRHRTAARAQRCNLEQRGDGDQGNGGDRTADQRAGVGAENLRERQHLALLARLPGKQNQYQHQIDCHHNGQHGKRKQEQHALGLRTRQSLTLKEVHRIGLGVAKECSAAKAPLELWRPPAAMLKRRAVKSGELDLGGGPHRFILKLQQ